MVWNLADYQAIWLSAKVAVTATLVSLPLGVFTAYMLTYCRFRGKAVVEMVVGFPLTMPPVVVGYALLLLLGNHGLLGPCLRWAGVQILFTWKAAVIASMVVGFPLLVRSIRIGMETVDSHLLQAAGVLGAGRWDRLVSVILPLSRRGIAAGSSLMFARSLGEFGATIIVAGNIPGVTQTIPLAIYDYANSVGGNQAALVLCAVSAILSLATLGLHERLAKPLNRTG